MAKRRNFEREAAQLIIKKEIPFFGYTVFLEHVDLGGNTPPARYFPDTLSFAVLVPRILSRRNEIIFIDYALGIVERYIGCVLWRAEFKEETK